MAFNRLLGNLATDLDSAATGTFLSRDDVADADFVSIAYTDLTQRPSTVDSAGLTSLIDSAYIQARQSAAVSTGLDSAAATALFDSDYVSARTITTTTGFKEYQYTATSGQTTFQDSDNNSQILSYSPGGVLVFYNGILMRKGALRDYQEGSNSIVLNTGADSGANITIAKWQVAGGGSSTAWYGTRGIVSGGRGSSAVSYNSVNTISYITIASPGNSTDFGDLQSNRHFSGSASDGTYGIITAGFTSSSGTRTNEIDYVTIATTGNSSDFGDTISAVSENTAVSDGTYGVIAGGSDGSYSNVIQYVTIASPGNATDFGDLTAARFQSAGCSDATRGVISGGFEQLGRVNTIDYVTIASPGNATDFGDLTEARRQNSSCSDTTRGIIGGGQNAGGRSSVIDYVTIATTSNATSFGNLSQAREGLAAAADGTYATFSGGYNASPDYVNTIDYVTIQTTGNASDFGDLDMTRAWPSSCSGT